MIRGKRKRNIRERSLQDIIWTLLKYTFYFLKRKTKYMGQQNNAYDYCGN